MEISSQDFKLRCPNAKFAFEFGCIYVKKLLEFSFKVSILTEAHIFIFCML